MATIPINNIPKDMMDVKAEVIYKGLRYKVTFTKPTARSY
jgi:hypothetical protein